MSEQTSLLLEIGCEEIPARFLEGAERELGEKLEAALRQVRLLDETRSPQTASTPRRLAAWVDDLAGCQPDRTLVVLGPPAKAAYDREGRPTRVAEGFAAKHRVRVEDLRRSVTAKGEYVSAEIRETGRAASQVLLEIIPQVIGGITFPKTMYWTAKSGPFFVRPIRWIAAVVWDGAERQVIPFEFAGVRSGGHTFGHRLRSRDPIEITTREYSVLLEKHDVAVHAEERRKRIRDGIEVLLEDSGLSALADEWLENWVVNSTEWPAPLMGAFDARYLALPREVLVTVMRDHQKYFAIEDAEHHLQPRFITVLNVPGDPKGLIRQGHERVLAARFADAEFFWNADQKVTLGQRIPMLERVTYQAKLGSYADKVRRMKRIAEAAYTQLEKQGRVAAEGRSLALRAIDLCKCDLTTQMVQEFTELQGLIGGLYAKAQGEPLEIATAIYEHYRPAGLDDSCPGSVLGGIVSLSDKFDSVTAGFAAGLEPTGSSDPFGLRRAGNGIIKVSVEVLPGLDLSALLDAALASMPELQHGSGVKQRLSAFFIERLEFYLVGVAGGRYDAVRAAVRSYRGWSAPSVAFEIAKALDAVRDSEDFMALAAAAKRTRNILEKSSGAAGRPLDPELLAVGPELDLYHAYLAAKESLARSESDGDYAGGLRSLGELRPKVDAYFDRVLVMDPDERIRANRLRLLSEMDSLVFRRLADLSEVVPAHVDAPTSGRK